MDVVVVVVVGDETESTAKSADDGIPSANENEIKSAQILYAQC